jgi:hypothetical protein
MLPGVVSDQDDRAGPTLPIIVLTRPVTDCRGIAARVRAG